VLFVVGIDDLVVEKKCFDPKNHHELVVGRCEFQVHAPAVLLRLDLNVMVLCQLKSLDVGCMWLSTTQYTHELEREILAACEVEYNVVDCPNVRSLVESENHLMRTTS